MTQFIWEKMLEMWITSSRTFLFGCVEAWTSLLFSLHVLYFTHLDYRFKAGHLIINVLKTIICVWTRPWTYAEYVFKWLILYSWVQSALLCWCISCSNRKLLKGIFQWACSSKRTHLFPLYSHSHAKLGNIRRNYMLEKRNILLDKKLYTQYYVQLHTR